MVSTQLESLGVTFVVFTLLAYSFALPISAGVLFAGQMGTMAVAAYVCALGLLAGWPAWLAFAAGVLAALVLAALLVRPALRLGELSMAIVTLGVSQVVLTIASNLDITNRSIGLRNIPVTANLIGALALLAIWLGALLIARRRGLLYLARLVREDARVAQSCGIDAHRVRIAALLAGALASGLAGALYASYLTYVSPAAFGFQTLLQIIAFALVGGILNPYGSLLGTALLWVIPQYVPVLGDWRFVTYGAVVIVMTLFRPTGLLGERRPRIRAATQKSVRRSDEAAA
ncbi:MAG TPA: branched-chain amino acid ABC transporter permease [Ramlibacter sp.]|uniref:branched-chain amino acid ABC transporter permease n=1 Tax=Ramlibacter sp. TaxID=1917967 RepID=UPI002BC72D02|nr:branched-chain amino acid ABC transporter permease [Ramlibacter sp.]HVZ42873.1 branched-chain amino acid ABC transporter permease [Ramlibacter sp.]